jgi:hypothetical protein
MKRMTIPLLLFAWTVALIILTGLALLSTSTAGAQAPRGRQQWEYASLIFGDTALDMHWQAGKTTLSSRGDVDKPDDRRSINELYRKLGGKEEDATFGMLLNLVGQDGWEMVAYARPSGVQTWMFKRAIP